MIEQLKRAALPAIFAAAALTCGVNAAAQEAQTPVRATLTVSGKGGASSSYEVTDFSLSLTKSYSGYGQPAREVSLGLNMVRVADAAMLQWMGETLPGGERNAVLTVEKTEQAGGPVKYTLEGARITGFAVGYSSNQYLNLQLTADKLTINGVAMK
jgi:hypothetical protein